MKKLLLAASLGIMVGSVAMSGSAFAAQGAASQTTSVTITSSKSGATTGSLVAFHAAITPVVIAPNIHITGTVAWTITGSDGSTVACNKSTNVHGSGRVLCIVNAAQLQAAASPYAVVASYSGDANFAPSSATFSQVVASKQPGLFLHWITPPSNGGASVVSVKIKAGTGTRLVAGNVVFSIASDAVAVCTNGTAVPRSPGAMSVALGSDGSAFNEATCSLPAGWITVPSATNHNAHPKTRWYVTATYVGTTNFGAVYQRVLHGTLR